MKTWLKIILICAASIPVAILSVSMYFSTNRIKDLRERCSEQSQMISQQQNTIDSLLHRRDHFMDCHLYVTDKSRSNIYGRYNRGSITMPSEKTYTLVIDSTKVTVR